ncbi:MAG: hypothetical protein ABI488_12530 [Polyangiaceae bacterium]
MLAWIATLGDAAFERKDPFGDGRRIFVRRGKELGHRYGMELGRREVQLHAGRFWLIRFRQLLSPPAANPKLKPLSAEALRAYSPETDVLLVPGAEIGIPREPAGFSDEELEAILRAIQVGSD